MSLDCKSATHTFYEAYASIFLLLYPILTPAIYLYLLAKHRDRINPAASSETEAIATRSADPAIAPFRMLFVTYRPAYWRVARPTCHL